MANEPVRLRDIAKFIRSKNAGPFRLTFDIVFESVDGFQRVRRAKAITRRRIAEAFSIPEKDVSSLFEVEMGNAYKVTLIRPVAQGAMGETDIYGCQQHVPLLNLTIEQ